MYLDVEGHAHLAGGRVNAKGRLKQVVDVLTDFNIEARVQMMQQDTLVDVFAGASLDIAGVETARLSHSRVPAVKSTSKVTK